MPLRLGSVGHVFEERIGDLTLMVAKRVDVVGLREFKLD